MSDSAALDAPTSTILFVEDDEDMQNLVRFYLEREGFGVLVAPDGQEALNLIDRTAPPALAILDLMLPYADGLQIVRHIRAKVEWAGTPILVLTAKSDERDVVFALDAGANDYVVKPFRPQELLARLRRLVRS